MFKNNLVAIAGLEIKEKTFLLFMFETYNRPLRSPSSYFDQYRNRKDGFFLVDGDLENPFFSWPVFLKIKTKKQ